MSLDLRVGPEQTAEHSPQARHTFLADNVDRFVEAAKKRKELAEVSTTQLPRVPQVFVKVDRDKGLKQGVPLPDVYRTMQAFMGGYFINYFNRFGRQWQVYIEAEGEYRASAENLGLFYVRNSRGESVPLSAVAKIEHRVGPEFIMHYNEYPSAQINARAATGLSTGQAMKALEEVFSQMMPAEMTFDYLACPSRKNARRRASPPLSSLDSLYFACSSFSRPNSKIGPCPSASSSAPTAILGAFLALTAHGFENNVYAQIGLIMLIGLAAKNAILIVLRKNRI